MYGAGVGSLPFRFLLGWKSTFGCGNSSAEII
jgi:hypothetical protein